MNIAVFAHYDKDNLIDDSVVYYIEELRKITDKIIFVSDSEVLKKELDKLEGLVDFVRVGHHGEYDFGSYKRGYCIAQENNLLDNADNLLLVNDSCIGPFVPFEKVFEKMNTEECDFWGITKNKNFLENKMYNCENSNDEHVQSYFLVLKKQVFESEVFKNFINNVKKEETKEDIILKYEIGLSNTLCTVGFKPSVYSQKSILEENTKDFILLFCDEVFIFAKKGILKDISMPIVYKQKIKKNQRLLKIVNNYLKRVVRHHDFDIIELIQFVLLELKYIRKHFVKIHFKEKRVFLLGKWYSWA